MKKSLLLSLCSLVFVVALQAGQNGSDVVVRKRDGRWDMLVDGKPFYIKGISANDAVGAQGEDYLKMAAEAGANTVRVYGDVTKDYLDRAEKNGLKVDVGFWLNAIRLGTQESYLDVNHRRELKEKALAYVHRFKDHPAVLMWTTGNEVFGFTENAQEREAFGHFLHDLVQAIHREDPRHPVMYASSHTRDLPDLKRWVPHIDIVGVNVTGGAGSATRWTERNDFDRPVVVSEFGPLGSWEQRKDLNGLPFDAFDQMKADNYVSSWRQILDNQVSAIGGFAFVLGDVRNQDSLTWYNMNYHDLKRAGYWAVAELYTGHPPTNRPPKIGTFEVEPNSKISPDSRIKVSVSAIDSEHDHLSYEYFITDIASDPLIVEKPTFFPTETKVLGPGKAELKVPSKEGMYRVYVAIRDGHGNVAIANHSIVVGNTAAPTN